MQGIFQKENTDKALKYGIYRHLPTYEKIIRNLVSFYIKKDDYNKCIYHKRDMDATERTVVVMKDADILIKICDSTGDFDDTSEYQLLIRLLKERTIIDDGGSRRLRQKRGS